MEVKCVLCKINSILDAYPELEKPVLELLLELEQALAVREEVS